MEVPGRKITGNLSNHFPLGSEEDILLFCKPCDRDGPRVPAHGFCKNCGEHLCETCFKIHQKPTPCRKHILLDKANMPQTPCRNRAAADNILISQNKHQSVWNVPDDLTEPCQVHQGKFIEYFCCNHNFLGCGPCIMISHRNCDVDYIPEVSKNYTTHPEYLQLIHSLNILNDSCKKITNYANTEKIKIQKNQTALQNRVKKFRQEINIMLDKWEADINQQSYGIFVEENARTDSIITASNKLQSETETFLDNFKTLVKENKINALLIEVKMRGALVKQYTAIVKQMQEKRTENQYLFEPNLAIEKMLKLVTKLGTICVHTKVVCEPQSQMHKEHLKKQHQRLFKSKRKRLQPIAEEISEENAVNEEIQVERKGEFQAEVNNATEDIETVHTKETTDVKEENEGHREEVYEKLLAKPVCNICVRIPNDKVRCRNKAIAVVEKDKIAVVDSENLAVKLIDTKQEIPIYDRELSSRPNGVAVLPGDLLAVALPEESTLLFLAIYNRLSEAYHLKVDGRCTDVAYCSGKLVVTYQNPGKVEIMDEKGQIFKTIQQNIHGASLYDDSRVTVGMDNKSFYISDRFFKNVKHFNWNGELIREYNDQRLIRPCGLIALADGSLLVCNSSSNSIHLISANFKQDRIILKKDDRLTHPWAIAIDKEQNKLFVGSVDTSDYLNVYQLNV